MKLKLRTYFRTTTEVCALQRAAHRSLFLQWVISFAQTSNRLQMSILRLWINDNFLSRSLHLCPLLCSIGWWSFLASNKWIWWCLARCNGLERFVGSIGFGSSTTRKLTGKVSRTPVKLIDKRHTERRHLLALNFVPLPLPSSSLHWLFVFPCSRLGLDFVTLRGIPWTLEAFCGRGHQIQQ